MESALLRDISPRLRRAMSMPAPRSLSTMVSSDRTAAVFSASISCLMWCRTASAECASPPSADAIAEVKKYFNSKMPRLVAMYLLAVTRDTVDSCIAMASATVLRLSGLRWGNTKPQEPVLLADNFGRDLQNGLWPADRARARASSRTAGNRPDRSSSDWFFTVFETSA